MLKLHGLYYYLKNIIRRGREALTEPLLEVSSRFIEETEKMARESASRRGGMMETLCLQML